MVSEIKLLSIYRSLKYTQSDVLSFSRCPGWSQKILETLLRVPAEAKLEAGGKPSTWFPPGGLVEHERPCEEKIAKTTATIFSIFDVLRTSPAQFSGRHECDHVCQVCLRRSRSTPLALFPPHYRPNPKPGKRKAPL